MLWDSTTHTPENRVPNHISEFMMFFIKFMSKIVYELILFYSQDKTLARPLSSVDDKNELYSRLKAAAETGWDFSSKHYNNFGQNTGNNF